VASVLAWALLLTCLIGIVGAPLLVWLIGSGLAEFELAATMTRWMFPYIAFMSMVALSAGILNTWKRFAVGWASLKAAWHHPGVRRVLSRMAPALVGVSVAQISLLINTQIASHVGVGAVSWLTYADRLMEFPTALLGVALGVVLLPQLSAAQARDDTRAYSAMLDNARAAAARSPVHVTLVDSGSTGMAQGLVVLAAAALAAEGRTSDEVAGGALIVAKSCRFLFTVEGFDYLRRGGRVSAMVRAFGNLLHVHPVISIHDGETTVVDRARSDDRAHHVIRSSMELYASTLAHPAACIGVQIGTNPKEAAPLNIRGPVITVAVGGSLAAHTGPGTCGVAIADMPPEFRRAHGGRDGRVGP
jgi:hypothetical protein